MAKNSKKPEKVKAPKAPKPVKAPKAKGKNKKNKGDVAAAAGMPNAGVPTTGAGSVPLANLSPEQMTAAQLEQAIKESNDPSTKLKKLRSPLNVRSCLLNVLFLIVLTFGVVVLWCFLAVDKFNFVTVMTDMLNKFHIIEFFTNIGNTIAGWFS